ncbi:MAG: adenosylcobinamide-GDP ribazoletransferase [Chloroflexi bacterium]|nr:MAG: adenosylcobinamide-GDP ribazoletransferase [Chloroflexota bacterium]RLC80110.1 MAG: adenosylcobinamide-GDP ribazoletransferase [Chloroflexota bacterium]HEY73526.1 adenosylcobinamide-GDP ribazoletransferase [Thermoflexia bacterium]
MSEAHEEGRGDGWISRLFVPPLAALQFLTLIPPVVRRPFTSVEMGRAVGYFPLTGALLGALLVGLNWGLAQVFPSGVSAGLVLASWVVVTGALHLDGFLDTCDGLFGGYTPESRMDIMRDERVGAFGLAGGVLLLLLKYAALIAIPHRTVALLLAPTLARWGMALAVVLFPYARSKGLGRVMKDHAGWQQAILATAIGLATAWFVAGWPGLAALALAGVATLIAARFVLARLPGLTGDVYGAICELVEVMILIAFSAE